MPSASAAIFALDFPLDVRPDSDDSDHSTGIVLVTLQISEEGEICIAALLCLRAAERPARPQHQTLSTGQGVRNHCVSKIPQAAQSTGLWLLPIISTSARNLRAASISASLIGPTAMLARACEPTCPLVSSPP